MGAYEEALDALDEQQPAATSPATNPYLQTLDAMEKERAQPLRTATIQAHDQDPERAASVQKLAATTGLAPEVVERNFDDLSKRVKVESAPFQQMQDETPALAQWASDPANAAVAKDDMESLGFLEWLTKAPSRAFAQAMNQSAYSRLRYQSMRRELTQEEKDQLQTYKYNAELGGALGAGRSWFRKAITGTGQFLANQVIPFQYGAAGAAEIGTIGAIGGSILPGAGTVAGGLGGASIGFGAGMLYGVLRSTFEQEAGGAYDEYLGFHDELGRKLDPEVAKAAALATGLINAPIEAGAQELLLRSIPGLNKLGALGTRNAVKAALRNPTIRGALAGAVKSYAGTLTGETAQEVAQRAVTILSGEIAKYASGSGLEQRTPSDILGDLAREGAAAAQSFALGVLAGPTMQLAHDAHRAQQATKGADFFKALSEGAAQSKTVARMPEAAQAFLAQATAGGPVESVYAPIDTFTKYWQDQQLDPAEIAAELTGDTDAYALAVSTGTDLKIPTAAYAVKIAGTAHAAYFNDELRLEPDAMNAREARAFTDAIQAQQEAAKEAAAPSPAQQVRAQLAEQLASIGVPAETAQTYAALYEGAFGTIAERADLDAAELYRAYGLTVDRPDITAPLERGTPAPAALEDPAAPRLPLGTPGEQAMAPGAILPEEPPIEPAPPEIGGFAAGPVKAGGEGTAAATRNEPIDLSNPVEAARRMREENPQIEAQAADLAARARASRTPAPPRAVVDKNAPTGETGAQRDTASLTGEQLPGPRAEPLARPGGGAESRGGEAPRPEHGAALRIPPSARDHFATVAADVRARGVDATDDQLAARYLELVDRAHTIAADLEDIATDYGWRELLTEISKAGGISAKAEGGGGQLGEIAWYMESLAQGSGIITKSGRTRVKRQGQRMPLNSVGIEGAPGIFKRIGPGLSFDGMREHLAQDPRWAHLVDINDLHQLLEGAVQAARAERQGITPTKAGAGWQGVFENLLEVREGGDWFTAETPGNLLEAEDLLETDLGPANAGDTSFDVEEFNQGLFDDLAVPDPTARLTAETRATPERGIDRLRRQAAARRAEVASELATIGQALAVKLQNPRGQTITVTASARTPGVFQLTTYTAETQEPSGHTEYPTFAQAYESARGLYGSGTYGPSHGGSEYRLVEIRDQDGTKRAVDQVDVLDTGERQARLPEAGAVREQEIATPQLEAPFALTSEVAKPAKGKQTTLFQGPHPRYTEAIRIYRERRGGGPAAMARAIAETGLPAPDQTTLEELVGEAEGDQVRGAFVPAVAGAALEQLAPAEVKGIPDARVVPFPVLSDAAATQLWLARDPQSVQQTTVPIASLIATQATFTEAVVRDYMTAPSEEVPTVVTHNGQNIIVSGHHRLIAAWAQGAQTVVVDAMAVDPAKLTVTEFGQAAVPLTNDLVAAFADQVKAEHGADLAAFDLYVTNQGDLKLDTIAIARGAQRAGLGSRVMVQLAQFADTHHARIILSLAQAGYEPIEGGVRTTSRARLERFYRRFGFVANRGRHKDFTIRESMYRDPTVGVTTLYQAPPPLEGFYSRLSRAVDEVKQDKATGAQWQAMIKNAKIGTNKDEFAYARLEQLEKDRTYTKADLHSYLAANSLRVEIRSMAEGHGATPIDERRLEEMTYRIMDEMEESERERLYQVRDYSADEPQVEVRFNEDEEQWEAFVDGEDLGHWFDTEDEAQREADAEAESRRESEQERLDEELEEDARANVDRDDAVREARRRLGYPVDEDEDGSAGPAFEDYSLPGALPGTYDEVFLTLPDATHAEWTDGHDAFAQIKNPIVRLRVNERQLPPGVPVMAKRILIPPTTEGGRWKVAIEGEATHQQSYADEAAARLAIADLPMVDVTPPGPTILFLEEVQTPQPDEFQHVPPLLQKHWREIAFKWALYNAAKRGLAGVAWTTGEQQADRYSLSRAVDNITWEPHEEGRKRISVDLKDQRTERAINFYVNAKGIVDSTDQKRGEQFLDKPLAEILGKEIADKILAVEGEGGKIDAEGLKVGGAGLRRLYDVDFRNVANAIPAVKKNGGKVGDVEILQRRRTGQSRNAMQRAVAIEPTQLATYPGETYFYLVLENGYRDREVIYDTEAAARSAMNLRNERVEAETGERRTTQPGIMFTPQLREAILGGQALFQPPPTSDAFRAWFGDSKVVDATGAPLVVHHGTSRGDRVGNVFRKNRATSGPMAFFTTDRAIAEKYATGKQDTSFEQPESYAAWFKFKPAGSRTEVDLPHAWFHLTNEERQTVLDRLPTVGYENHDQATGPIVAGSSSIGGKDTIAHYLQEARGNGLAAAMELWLSSGSLFDQEERFLEVLEGLGLGGRFRFDDPHRTVPTVYDVYLKIENPLVTAAIPPAVLDALEKRSRRQRAKREVYGADFWDKNTRDAREWIALLKADLAKGENSFVWSSIPDWVTATLKEFGYDGIRDTGGKMGGPEHDVWVPFEPTQIKSATDNRGTFDPSSTNILHAGGRRGAIRFGADRQFSIDLLERADLSTFLHESGHFFLEVLGDVADRIGAMPAAEISPSQQRLLADYQALLGFAGVTARGDLAEVHHEKIARAFEAYLMEGRAPSVELRSAFARFRAWLVGIYRTLKGLDVELTAEVRQVFDRMLATDQALADAAAQAHLAPMFLTAEAAGMSAREFDLYRQTLETASVKAREQLEQRLLAEVARTQQAEWADARNEITAQVAAEVYQRPVYRVLAAMQRGTHPDGSPFTEGLETEPFKLSRAILVARYGEARLKRLPTPYIYQVEGGLDPDSVAQMFGFSSGDAMLTAVENAPPMRDVIRQETSQRLFARFGSILLDGSLYDQARAALGNDGREEVVRAELRALGKLRRTVQPFVQAERQAGAKALAEEKRERAYERRWMEAEAKLRVAIAEGRKQAEIDALRDQVQRLRERSRRGPAIITAAIPPASAMREAARTRIARTRLRDLKPAVFWSASRQAAQRALEAAARQDFDAAIVAKQQELLNLALYREAERARDDADARVKRAKDLGKPAARQRLGLAGAAYLDQVDGILDRYEFARVSQKVLDRRASLRKFVAGIEGEGLPIDLPEELLEETRRTNYLELTVEELVGVTDGLQQIVHLARLKNRLLKAKAKRELDEVAGTLAESIREHARRPRREGARDRRPSEERRRMIADFFGGHRKLASLLRELDGFEDGGPAWDAIMRTLNEAGATEADMQASATRNLAELVERAFPGAQKRTLYQKRYIPALGQSLSRMERIGVAFNWGNEGNRERVRLGLGWNDEQVQAVLDTLSAGELAFVQGVLDLVNGYWPAIAAKQERVYGVAPEKVEATAITAKAGTIAGGYFPIKYDDRLSASAIGHLDLEAANLARQAAYAQATTKRGHTKERVARVKLPVRLDFGVIFEHVGQVIHDLSHHEALIDVGRILGHRDVQQAILDTQGDLVYKQIRNTIRDVAFGDVPATNGFERVINHVRMGATVAGLGWNLTTAFLQPIGLTNSIVRIGPKWVAKGLGRWLRNPFTMTETVKWIEERSAFMRSRARTQQREINEIRNSVGVETGKLTGWIEEALRRTTFDTVTKQGIVDSYFWMIQQAQRIADVPTWLGAYEKAIAAGEEEDRAAALADQAVLDSQGGGQTKDLAQVQRGGPMFKLWTNFYSYFNVVYNQAVEARRRTRFSHPAEVGRLGADYLMLFIVPATLGFLVREAMRASGGGEPDKDFWKRLALENAGYVSGLMLGVREVAGVFAGAYGYEGPAGARAFAALGRLGQQVQQGKADAAFWRSLNDVAGVLVHYPSSQLWRTWSGFLALEEGKTQNPGVIVAGPPPKAKK